jgi:hypothetical protein
MASELNEVLIMGDPFVPERAGGHSGTTQEHTGIPAMPVIYPRERDPCYPHPLLDGPSPTLGWEFRPSAQGGPAFVIMRRTGLGSLKVVDSCEPLTTGNSPESPRTSRGSLAVGSRWPLTSM